MVPGEGPLPAFGLVLGEAPGEQEAEQLRPFVGPSGGMLDQAFKILDLRRDELYITNIVKEWPRNELGATRRPSPEEINVWRPVLLTEIEQCSPAAILLLGKTATEAMGWSPSDAETHSIFSAWHPAYLLHRKGGPHLFEQWLFQLRPFAHAVKFAQERA